MNFLKPYHHISLLILDLEINQISDCLNIKWQRNKVFARSVKVDKIDQGKPFLICIKNHPSVIKIRDFQKAQIFVNSQHFHFESIQQNEKKEWRFIQKSRIESILLFHKIQNTILDIAFATDCGIEQNSLEIKLNDKPEFDQISFNQVLSRIIKNSNTRESDFSLEKRDKEFDKYSLRKYSLSRLIPVFFLLSSLYYLSVFSIENKSDKHSRIPYLNQQKEILLDSIKHLERQLIEAKEKKGLKLSQKIHLIMNALKSGEVLDEFQVRPLKDGEFKFRLSGEIKDITHLNRSIAGLQNIGMKNIEIQSRECGKERCFEIRMN